MTQELTDLRASILEGRYEDALSLVDELEGMSKKSILRNIKNFLIRMLVHLIKNQVEQRLTNSWYASIRDSILEPKFRTSIGKMVNYGSINQIWLIVES